MMLSVEAIDLYYGASHTLRRVSLTARKGEVTCIAASYLVMQRGEVVLSGRRKEMDESVVRGYLTI